MRILAFDTALGACSAALWDAGKVVARRHRLVSRGHAEMLMPMIEAVRHEADLPYSALDLIAVTVGPGTFTGIRIGIAAARGLGLATGVPVAGFTSLHVMAQAAAATLPTNGRVVIAVDARRGQVYVEDFRIDGAATGKRAVSAGAGPQVLAPAEAAALAGAAPAVLAGSGAAIVRRAMPHAAAVTVEGETAQPDAAVLAELAAMHGPPRPDLGPPAPLYLRPPDAKLPAGSRTSSLSGG